MSLYIVSFTRNPLLINTSLSPAPHSVIPPTIRSRSNPIWKSGAIGNKRELNGSDRKLSGNERQRSGMVGKAVGDLLPPITLLPRSSRCIYDLKKNARVHRSYLDLNWSAKILVFYALFRL